MARRHDRDARSAVRDEPARRGSGTSATRATSSASSCGWSSRSLLLLFVELADATSAGVSERPRRRRVADPDTRCASSRSRSTQIGALLVPAVDRARAAVSSGVSAGSACSCSAAAVGAGALRAARLAGRRVGPGRRRGQGRAPGSPTHASRRSPTWPARPRWRRSGKPWLGRSWRRAADLTLLALAALLAVAGTAGVPELVLTVAAGIVAGAAVLVALGAPNRRPSPAAVAAAPRGPRAVDVDGLALRRADGGRSQLYDVRRAAGGRIFVKVYGRDSRDADLLYRSVPHRAPARPERRPGRRRRSARDVEHEALLVLLARRAGVATPAARGAHHVARRIGGARPFAYVDGRPLDELGRRGDRPDAARRGVGRRRRACTAPVSRTGRCGRPTSWSTAPAR